MQVYVDYIKNIDWSQQHQRRSGAVVYTTYADRILLLMGVDTDSGDVTDFGGGVKIKHGEGPLDAAVRELKEESYGVLGEIKKSDISDHLAIYTDELMIIFIHITFDVDAIMIEFNFRRDKMDKPEVDSLILMNIDQFKNLVKGGSVNDRVMYSKVKEVLQGAISKNFMEYL